MDDLCAKEEMEYQQRLAEAKRENTTKTLCLCTVDDVKMVDYKNFHPLNFTIRSRLCYK